MSSSTQDTQADYLMLEPPDSPPETQAHTGPAAPAPKPSAHADAKVNHGAPGSSWNNKRWLEECERLDNMVQDREWDHKRYGDPLLDD